jgi:hypothetical protein
MEFQKHSRITFGRLTHLISNPMEDQLTSDVLLPTLGGGNFSDIEIPLLSMKEERSWKFKAMLIQRTEILLSPIKTIKVFINNGISSMPMNGKESQERESLMKNSVFMLRDHSTLLLK